MFYQKMNLRELFPALPKTHREPTLTAYCIDNSPEIDPERRRPAVLICPGGGYSFTSEREAEPIALAFLGAGFSAFILNYSVAPDRYPVQLLEASAAMTYIRRNAEKFHLDPNMLAVCGFSAGAHLAGSLGTLYKEPVIRETLAIAEGENRPDAMILCYPVITGGEKAHRGSFDNLLGKDASPERIEALSLENRVTGDTPPAFLWHTFSDNAVPVENSLLMANALRRAGVEFDLHIFRDGPHGLSLANAATASMDIPAHINPHAEKWMGLCCEWMKDLFGYRG